MIQDWRRAFRDELLPFEIVGLTASGQPQTLENFELRMVDARPFIREGQFKAAQELENVCFIRFPYRKFRPCLLTRIYVQSPTLEKLLEMIS